MIFWFISTSPLWTSEQVYIIMISKRLESNDFLENFILWLYVYITAEISTIVCNEDKVSSLLERAHSCKGLKHLIKIGTQVTEEQSTTAKGLGLQIMSFSDLEVGRVLSNKSPLLAPGLIDLY